MRRILSASVFAVILLLATMFAPANAFDFIKGVDYSLHMPGENCSEFGKANYSQDFEWMKQANINTIRTYDWIPEEILANAAEYEIKVIEGIWIHTDGNFSDETFKNECKNHIAEVINRDKDKPCIIGWCIGNELNENAVEKVGKEETEKFLEELYNYAKSLDSNQNHFVTHANWPPLDSLDLSFFDVISFNVYSYWPPKVVSSGYYGYLCYLKSKYPDKPILITEFGYSTSPNGSGNCGYGRNSEEEQADCIKQRWNDIVRVGCLGGIVFEWNDEWWKNNCTGDDKNSHNLNDPEEWFGVIAVNGTDPDNYTLRKKQAYYAIKERFGEEYPTKADLTSPVIDDFEDADMSDWFAISTPNASISLSSSNNSKVGNYSMKIAYNINEYDKNWCLVYRQVNRWVNYDNVSLWVYGDNSGNTLEIKLEEDYGEERWVYAPIINWSGWKKLEIPISSFSAEEIANGIFDKSKIKRFTLAISGANPSNSTIYVDDITLNLSDMSDDDFLDMVEHATFNYFWNEANQSNGLIRDRSTPDSPCSIAAVGFGLSAICIAESRGWVNRRDASDRILTTLETFDDLYNKEGFYYHWINMSTGEREWSCEVSSIDTALLMAGILHAGVHFKENESIRELSKELYERVNWRWMLNGTDTIAMKWTPEDGLSPDYWYGYNEAMILYLLAVGSPTHPVPDPKRSWDAWASTYGKGCGRMIDDFEDADLSDWHPFTNSSASISISPSNRSKIGDYSMKIDYHIEYNTGGEQCGIYMDKNTWANYGNVSLWVYGDNSGNTLRIKLEESRVGEHWIYESPLNWTDWKQFDIPLSSFKVWERTRKDGILDMTKVNRFTVVILGANTSDSTIYVDDFKLPCNSSNCSNGEDFIYCWTGSLFTYQYSHCWVDFRNRHDAYADYWQNSINAVKENRLFCIDESDVYATYGDKCWGLTACDGPCGYTGYGSCPAYYHDGTIAPTGAGGSVALAPDIAIPALRYMYKAYGGRIWGKYGFKDAFNLDTNLYLDGYQPWWDEDYIAIDEGAIILMIENHRSGSVWDEFMQNENIKKAMDAAGFMERGDVNSDHAHDKDDILALINHVGNPAVHPIHEWAGDVNCDGSVNMGDGILLLNHVGDPDRYGLGLRSKCICWV